MNNQIRILTLGLVFICISSCTPDCKDDVSSYNSGYSAGKLVKTTGSGESCSSWASAMVKQGLNVDANDCYCAGFNDGKAGNENKYK
jgi:hypothetical protein